MSKHDPMVFTIKKNASDQVAQEAERLHELLVDQRGYSSYDVFIVTMGETLNVTIKPGIATPPDWPDNIKERYCTLSKRERRQLKQRYCRPDRIHNALEENFTE
ncbi:hypothetical protein [Natrinema sp. 1APR25-10V2]|uniref:hypothetical protein n=1 Tax=Natrinema sp. 1APR25-10V2 TaxID=2951081 RepID=UPI00287541BD|nr:hypothetical protein [Natrinema sp. 1APR25-10V2]MDS0474365.1 hypothetical protein [Natrinema sp. 1APR25-10V2]